MVRILCLHGSGSSADIFESQTTALREMLPSHWQWVFYNAEIECGPLPQFEGVYPGPFYTAMVVPSVEKMRTVHEWMLDIIEEDGPFDGLFGFSAGGYNAVSLMMNFQKNQPTQQPPFRFMVLMGGNLPYSADYDEGIDVTDWIAFHRMPLLAAADLEDIKAFNEWAPDNQDKRPDPMDKTGISPILHKIMDQHVSLDFDRKKFDSRLLHPEVTKIRVKVPTVHVLGRQDDAFKGAKNMLQLFEPKYRMEYIFEGGHELPRARSDLLKIKDMIAKTVQTSTMLS